MANVRKKYVVDGSDEYTIEFEPCGSYFLINAVEYPWCPYDTAELYTHVNPHSGRICVASGREPTSLDKAIAIAKVWMHGYTTYCKTGKFPNKGGRIST